MDDLFGRLGRPLSRRLFLAGATAGAATLGLAACGGGGSATATPPPAGSAGFPVTVQGKEGTATIPRAPQRVIALGFQRDTDTALALGVTPIAMTASASFTSRIAPWTEPRLGDPRPELLDDTGGIPFEKIAGLRPDLILATDNFELADGYARLAQIAPTVSYVVGPNDDTWQQRTTLIGKALGRDEQAQKIVTDTETKVAQAARDNPDFAGKTVSFSTKFGPDVFTVLKGDSAMTFLEQLGLQTSPEVAALEPALPAIGRGEQRRLHPVGLPGGVRVGLSVAAGHSLRAGPNGGRGGQGAGELIPDPARSPCGIWRTTSRSPTSSSTCSSWQQPQVHAPTGACVTSCVTWTILRRLAEY